MLFRTVSFNSALNMHRAATDDRLQIVLVSGAFTAVSGESQQASFDSTPSSLHSLSCTAAPAAILFAAGFALTLTVIVI